MSVLDGLKAAALLFVAAIFQVSIFSQARVLGGEPQPADDVSELRWFAADELPPDEELAFECVGLALAAWRQQHA